MSDITATNCGCERDCGCNNGCNGGCNNGCNGNGLFNFWGGNGNCSCILWILILLACCGNNDVKYTAKWGLQIAEMIFQKHSSTSFR